jgi:hypothetical protein
MSLDQTNFLNIGLMIGACAAAMVLPFELFLLAYALLGPLHYLTQIAWLHTRGYFSTGRWDALTLGVLCAVFVILDLVPLGLRNPQYWATLIMCLAFFGAFAFAFVANPYAKVGCIIAALLIASLVGNVHAAQVLFVVFLPTVIHVYLFTAAFILFGALRSRNASGLASLGAFVACTAVLFFTPATPHAAVSETVRLRYQSFTLTHLHLSAWLPVRALRDVDDIYASATGLLLMRLLAFAYTYHYLNWFSKTSVIQWHKVPKVWAAANLVLWAAAVGIFSWDYPTGVAIVFALSVLHVLLEFPLDYRTFAGIGREAAALARTSRLAFAPAAPVRGGRAARRRSAHSRSATSRRR